MLSHFRAFIFSLILSTLLLAGAPSAVSGQDVQLIEQQPAPISAEEFSVRRQSVRDALPDEAVAIFFSAPTFPRYGDIDYPFHQQADMRYLSGATMPGAVLLLAPGGLSIGGDEFDELLLVPDEVPNSQAHRWATATEFMEEGGIERVESAAYYEELLMPIIESDRRIYHLPLPEVVPPYSELGRQLRFFTDETQLLDLGTSPAVQDAAASMMEVDRHSVFRDLQEYAEDVLGEESFGTELGQEMYEVFVSAQTLREWVEWREEHLDYRYTESSLLRPLMDTLRLEKSGSEANQVAYASEISAWAAVAAIRQAGDGVSADLLQASAEYVITAHGADTAFQTNIRSGAHGRLDASYSANTRELSSGDLVVVGLGALHDGYASTIRRTVPVADSFSSEQRALYELVLQAQDAGIAAVQDGALFRDPVRAVEQHLADGLVELGVIDEAHEAYDYLPEIIAHYIGLHVRDGGFGEEMTAGQTMAIAAGVAIADDADVAARWRGLSVQLQDVVVLTGEEVVVLTDSAPRAIEAVEGLLE